MKDNEYNEYYIKAEEWPDPKDEEPAKDEPATLDESASFIEGSTVKKKDTKENKKAQRKKADMLNKSAGLLVGAAAVVMVAGTLTGGSGANSYTCPICSTENCEFWSPFYEMEGLYVDMAGNYYTQPTGDDYQLGMFGGNFEFSREETHSIYMADGRRAYMHTTWPDINKNLVPQGQDSSYNITSVSDYSVHPQTSEVIQQMAFYGNDVNMAELIYAPDGGRPEDTATSLTKEIPYTYMQQVPGEEYLWLRASSTNKSTDLESIINIFTVDIVGSGVNSFDMGSTMRFYESEKLKRYWADDYYTFYDSGHQGKGLYTTWGCNNVVYNFTGNVGSIMFSDIAYDDMFAKWQELNELAPRRGHRVVAMVYQLEDVEYNDITYQIYVLDEESTVDEGYELFLVPVQEKNCAIYCLLKKNAEEVSGDLRNGAQLAEILSEAVYADIEYFLSHIYLKADALDTDIPSIQEGAEGNKVTQNPLATQNVPVADNKALLDLSEYETVGWANGGVVPVQKDGLWGLIDYSGNEILAPTYAAFWCFPNDNGYTIFYEEDVPYQYSEYDYYEDTYYIVDKNGEVVTRWMGEVLNYSIGENDIIRLGHEHDGRVEYTYYRLDGSIVYNTGFYDHEAAFYYNNSMAFKDDAAYFSGVVYTGGLYDYNYVLYKLEPDGTLTIQEECSYVPVNNHSEGCMLVYNWGYATASCQLYDLNTRKLSNHFDYISGDLVPDFDYSQNSAITNWSYENIGENGYYMSNYGPYGVLNLTYNTDKTKDILVNFWDVEDDYVLDSCIAMYDDIIFDNYKHLAVQDGEQWYFINLDGDIVSGPYQDASSFNNEGYALVLEDNVAYLINDKFEALEKIENVEAASVSLNNSRFLIKGTDEALYLYNHDMN